MEPKVGLHTTEFWVTLGVQIVSILSVLGWLTPEDADKYSKAAVQVGGLIAMIVSAAYYSSNRARVKSSRAIAEARKAEAEACRDNPPK